VEIDKCAVLPAALAADYGRAIEVGIAEFPGTGNARNARCAWNLIHEELDSRWETDHPDLDLIRRS